jgi:DNA polymerase-3 subunit epsilon
MREAKETLFRITEKYGLCQKINGLYRITGPGFQYLIKICGDAYLGHEPTAYYNERVSIFLKATTIGKFIHLFEVTDRNEDEIGLVYIEIGVYIGFSFYPKTTLGDKNFFYFI